ncbi:MAG: hypothetical protein J3Q66DRAFT_375394 [Benniella sp.]|nr:MAG: hypothetical protein J3Q66DRAFT_375394 [Benniella sp.]
MLDILLALAQPCKVDQRRQHPPADLKPEANSHLDWRYLNEPSVTQLLSGQAQQELVFKQRLYQYIELSGSLAKGVLRRAAAANAITSLVPAGERFNGADKRGIRILGADLSNGIFESAQSESADVRQITLRGAWLLIIKTRFGYDYSFLPFLRLSRPDTSPPACPVGTHLLVS